MIPFETSLLVDCMIYSTTGLNNMWSFSYLNIGTVRMSDLLLFDTTFEHPTSRSYSF